MQLVRGCDYYGDSELPVLITAERREEIRQAKREAMKKEVQERMRKLIEGE